MRILERGAVYNGRDEIIGFRCSLCGKVVQSMFGDYCDMCRMEAKRHSELIAALKNNPPTDRDT